MPSLPSALPLAAIAATGGAKNCYVALGADTPGILMALFLPSFPLIQFYQSVP